MIFLYCLLWNSFIWGGTAYLVQVFDWSVWWFVLTFILSTYPGEIGNYHDDDDGDDSDLGDAPQRKDPPNVPPTASA